MHPSYPFHQQGKHTSRRIINTQARNIEVYAAHSNYARVCAPSETTHYRHSLDRLTKSKVDVSVDVSSYVGPLTFLQLEATSHSGSQLKFTPLVRIDAHEHAPNETAQF